MPKSRISPLTSYRTRMKRKGMVRVEVQVGKKDASLVRKLASALTDDAHAPSVRSLLQQHFSKAERPRLKDLLAAAPLEGIELIRDPDFGRDVEL